jgi:hypothetical protein
MKKKKNKLDKYFLLNWRNFFLIIVIWIVSVILHNLTYAFIVGILRIKIIDESFFFTIAVILIPIYFLISVTYTIIYNLKHSYSKRGRMEVIK